MKFAKELEENLVAEWKEKYLDYKGGKKKLKAVARAVRNADRPTAPSWPRSNTIAPSSGSTRDGPVQAFLKRSLTHDTSAEGQHGTSTTASGNHASGNHASDSQTPRGADAPPRGSQPQPINERSPLYPRATKPDNPAQGLTRYGSIIGSPPKEESPTLAQLQKQASLLELPDPALDPSVPRAHQGPTTGTNNDRSSFSISGSPEETRMVHPPPSQMSHRGNAYEISKPHDDVSKFAISSGSKSLPARKRSNTLSGSKPLVQRMFSISGSPNQPRHPHEDVALEAYREVDFRQAEFFKFLDKELEKIEEFYKSKEEEAEERMKVIREQLHVMRNRRLEEILQADQAKQKYTSNGSSADGDATAQTQPDAQAAHASRHSLPWLAPVANTVDQIDHAIGKVRPGRIGKTSRTMGTLGTPKLPADRAPPADYSRHPPSSDVPYRVAKRKLKVALAEFYRGLELLKSYALLNRTAFRKINKKYNKTVDANSQSRFMSEKVKGAYFVTSETLDGMFHDVEDLYARYFERGSRKVAVGKLRAKIAKAGDYTGSIWRQGVLATAGIVFGLQGLVYGVQEIYDPNPVTSTQAGYLLQIYAGYFLMLLLVSLFVIDARAFSQAKVNYQFVFEFDSRHMLDWRQLSELPAIFAFYLGLIMWLNFCRFGGEAMFVYWPVILIGLAVGTLFLPAPYLYHRSRGWFLYSNWRLLLAGVYPVEFRDFFLGDMFCSLTYAMGHLELFFCLYSRHWNEPAMCNSSHSRLLGFFTTIPGIWRALQCLRRYYDTRDGFPHLVNCGKYGFTILSGMALSLFRIERTTQMMALFIVFASINSIYCSIWDVIMDWSLGVPSAKHKFLRHKLAYKQIWWYYAAMVIDPILRCNWIFYVIYGKELQTSSMVAFLIGLSEVIRRGIWTLFRVENEHCNNVGRYRASRDVPLPYDIEEESGQDQDMLYKTPEDIAHDARASQNQKQPLPPTRPGAPERMPSERLSRDGTRASATDVEQGHPTTSAASLRRRRPSMTNSPIARAFRQAGDTMRSAHAKDYERKRKPDDNTVAANASKGDDDDDDDDDISSDSDDDAGRQQPRGARQHVERTRRHSSDEDEQRDLEQAEDLAARGATC